MQEWYVLFGKCGSCGRTGQVDRWELARQFGRRTAIMSLRPRLVCTKCGNRRNNTFAAAPMKR